MQFIKIYKIHFILGNWKFCDMFWNSPKRLCWSTKKPKKFSAFYDTSNFHHEYKNLFIFILFSLSEMIE